MKFKEKQKVTWHNNTECGVVIYSDSYSVTVKWEGAGTIFYDIQTAELYIK